MSRRCGRRRPRVLFAIGGLATGGSERQLVEFVLRAHPSEIEAAVVTWDPSYDSDNRKRLLAAGVRHFALGPFSVPKGVRAFVALPKLDALVRTLRPDVVYPWLEQASFLLTPVARAQGIPVVIARRNVSGIGVERVPPIGIAVRRVERLAAVVTGNSHAVLDAAERRGIARGRLRLVPNGHAPLDPLPTPTEPPVTLGYLAQFRREKGHRRLLDTLSRLPRDRSWRADLAGVGPLVGGVRTAIATFGLGDHVRLLGQVTGAREFWAGRSIGVLLSDHEGSPNALIEAAFAGRPLVGTAVGGIPEIIEPEGGFVVAPGDPAAAAAALLRLLRDGDLRTRLGAAAHRQVVARHDLDGFVAGHLAAIREAHEQGANGARRAG